MAQQYQRDPNALATLLRLREPSNLTNRSQHELDIITGADDLGPSDLELQGIQEQTTLRTPGGYTANFSREKIRDSAMQTLKRKLALGAIEHQQQMEKTLAPKRIEGQFQVEAAERSAKAAADRLQAQQDAIAERQRVTQEGLDRRLAEQERIGDERVAMRPAPGSRGGTPTEGMVKRLREAQSNYGGTVNSFFRRFGADGGRTAYSQALTDVLDRKGTLRGLSQAVAEAKAQGMTAEQALADAAANGVQLDPYEQEFVKLTLGR